MAGDCIIWLFSLRSLPGDMDEIDSLRSKRCNDDAVSLAPSIAESIIVEGEQTFSKRSLNSSTPHFTVIYFEQNHQGCVAAFTDQTALFRL